MSVKVFVQKDNSAKEIRDLVSLALPQRWGQRKENVACRTAVASKSYLAKKGKITANNQAAISSQFRRTRPFSTIRSRAAPLGHRRNNSLNLVYNSDVAKSMLTFCKTANAPEIIQAVEEEQGAAAGPARTTRRWLHDMGQTHVYHRCGITSRA
jgi:hypothetical protein